MTLSFKKRSQILKSDILDDKGKFLYIERRKKKVIADRYKNTRDIKLNTSYMYQKMAVLLDRKIFIEAFGIPRRMINASGYINVFDLHKKLSEIIRIYHLPNRHQKIYTKEEKQYMENIMNRYHLSSRLV